MYDFALLFILLNSNIKFSLTLELMYISINENMCYSHY